MIVDMRIYTARPGKLAAFITLYKDCVWDLQVKYFGRCLGWYTTVEGQLNQVVHLWAFDSQADREARRNAMYADPAWAVYVKHSDELGPLVSQENRILKSTDFSPT